MFFTAVTTVNPRGFELGGMLDLQRTSIDVQGLEVLHSCVQNTMKTDVKSILASFGREGAALLRASSGFSYVTRGSPATTLDCSNSDFSLKRECLAVQA